MAEQLIIRQSLLKKWLSCPMAFFLERQEELDGVPRRATDKTAAGTLTHEHIRRALTGVPFDDMLETIASSEHVDATTIQKTASTFISQWELFRRDNPIHWSDLELTVKGKGLDNTHSLLGTIDLVYDEFDAVHVVDWKTTSSWAIPITGMPAHRLQAGFYALLLERSVNCSYDHMDTFEVVYLVANKARGSVKTVRLSKEEVEEEKEKVRLCVLDMAHEVQDVLSGEKTPRMNPCACNEFYKPCPYMKRCYPQRYATMIDRLKTLNGE